MIQEENEQLASELRSSLIKFTQFFYPLLTGREFIISQPVGRESHHITICRALTQAARLGVLCRKVRNFPEHPSNPLPDRVVFNKLIFN